MAGIEDIPSYIFGGTSGTPSYEELLRRRQVAVANAMRGRKAPTTLGEGMTYLGEAIGDRLEASRLSEAERLLAAKDLERRKGEVAPTYTPGGSTAPPAAGAVPFSGAGAGNLSGVGVRDRIAALVQDQQDGAPQEVAQANPTWSVAEAPPATPTPGGLSDLVEGRRNAVGGIETGGRRNPYATVVDTGRGDSVYGRYGIKGSNIPEWTQAALGQRLTPRDFLNSEEAQNKVFDHRFGQYANRYGEEGAARAWFAGERGMNNPGATDRFGRLNVASYGQDYLNRLGGGGAGPAPGLPPVASPPRVASLGGAGGTMSDALPPEAMQLAALAPLTAPPADAAPVPTADENPPTPSDIKPMPVRTIRVAQAGPGIIPGSVAGLPGLPAAGVLAPPPAATAGTAPDMPPERAAIPPASPQRLPPDPGPEPERPKPLGPSPRQQYWAPYIDNPHISPSEQAWAKRRWDEEEQYRKELSAAQTNTWIDKRERWQKLTDERNKLIREADTFDIKQLKDRIDIRNAQFAAEKAPLDIRIQEEALKAKPEELAKLIQERKNLEVKYHMDIRTLYEPKQTDLGGAAYERLWNPATRGFGPMVQIPGSPPPKEEQSETQAKSAQYVMRSMQDLEKFDTVFQKGKALTNWSDHAKYNTPGVPDAVSNALVSDEYRSARVSIGNWASATMRLVSGAAYGEKEAMRELAPYIPIPGDTQAQLDEKAARRRDMTMGVGSTAGPTGKAQINALQQRLFDQEAAKPPIVVKSLEEIQKLPAGAKFNYLNTDGTVRSGLQVPKRKLY